MTLDEIFKKYKDPKKKFERKSSRVKIGYELEWLKGLNAWGNKESQKLGFIIPRSMIDGAQASDWEEYHR